jgi:hypothetical protein
MESASLPYSLFLILAELGLGTAIVMQAVDMRGVVPRGFIKATTVMVPMVLVLAAWVALTLDGVAIEGYRLDGGARDVTVALIVVATALSVLQNGALFMDRATAGRVIGGVLTVVALATLVSAAVMLRIPVWGMGLIFFSLLFGTLAVGLAVVGLSLGHWYLVTPRLPAQPLNEISFLLLIVLLVQVGLFGLAVALPVDEVPQGGRDIELADDVTFWLRILVGLAMPLVFGWMAWASSRARSMMAATGLLYLVTALVLAGEIAARALLFDSARPI